MSLRSRTIGLFVRVIIPCMQIFIIIFPLQALADGATSFYNFTFSSAIPAGGSIIGRFEVTPGGNGSSFPYTIIGITGDVSGFQVPDSNGSIYGLIPAGQFGCNDNYFSPNFSYVNGCGVSFRTNSAVGASFELFYNNPTWSVQDTFNGTGEVYFGTMTTSLSQ
jgi:hypothetical protein